MKRAREWFTADEVSKIELAIADAEKKSAGEIVLAIATRSGRYDRAEDIVGFSIALIVVAAIWWAAKTALWAGGWNAGDEDVPGLLEILLGFGLSYPLGVLLASRMPAMARPFIPRREMLDEVESEASRFFLSHRVHATAAGTGILIYISLFEKIVHVVGDGPITEKLDQPEWDGLRDLIVGGIKKDRTADALGEAVSLCGDKLALHFPRSADDRDEISNRILFLN